MAITEFGAARPYSPGAPDQRQIARDVADRGIDLRQGNDPVGSCGVRNGESVIADSLRYRVPPRKTGKIVGGPGV